MLPLSSWRLADWIEKAVARQIDPFHPPSSFLHPPSPSAILILPVIVQLLLRPCATRLCCIGQPLDNHKQQLSTANRQPPTRQPPSAIEHKHQSSIEVDPPPDGASPGTVSISSSPSSSSPPVRRTVIRSSSRPADCARRSRPGHSSVVLHPGSRIHSGWGDWGPTDRFHKRSKRRCQLEGNYFSS